MWLWCMYLSKSCETPCQTVWTQPEQITGRATTWASQSCLLIVAQFWSSECNLSYWQEKLMEITGVSLELSSELSPPLCLGGLLELFRRECSLTWSVTLCFPERRQVTSCTRVGECRVGECHGQCAGLWQWSFLLSLILHAWGGQ